VIVRMRYDPTTRNYVARRTAEGRTKMEIIRCLKRYLARQLYHHRGRQARLRHLRRPLRVRARTDLRAHDRGPRLGARPT
jgi:hypothetical protein